MTDFVRRLRGGVGAHAPDPIPDPKRPENPPPPGPDVVPQPPVSDPTPAKPPAPVREPSSPRPPTIVERVIAARHGHRASRTLH